MGCQGGRWEEEAAGATETKVSEKGKFQAKTEVLQRLARGRGT